MGGAYAASLQPDGKIVTAGWSFPASPGSHAQFALARYNGDGSLDATFGSGGMVRTRFSGNAMARALVLQPDGKIVAAGNPGFALARYNPDGSLDTGFGAFGIVVSSIGNAFALGLQPDGKLVVAGVAYAGSAYHFVVARYGPDGRLDGGFGNGGVVTTAIFAFDEAAAVAIQPDGRIVVAGRASFDMNKGPALFALARYNSDGSLDATFGNGGVVTTAFGNGYRDGALAVALQSDGRIVVAGASQTSLSTGRSVFTVARYKPDGTLDDSFGVGGWVTTRFPSRYADTDADVALAVAVQGNGAIVAAGHCNSYFGDFALARYNPDGSPDTGFGNAGRVTTSFSTPGTIVSGNGFYGLALQPDRRIVGAGNFSGAFALARYDGGALAPVAAVLPASRSVQVGVTATVFATMIGVGPGVSAGCRVAPAAPVPVSFLFQTTDPGTNLPTGSPNTPADIPAGARQTFVLAFTPTQPFAATEVPFTFGCANTDPAVIIPGVNTLLLSSSGNPIPDIVALAATLKNDGIVNVPGATGIGVFAVATVNLGAGASITASADTGGTSLPVSVTMCQTNPQGGACLGSPSAAVLAQINSGETPTFGIFVQGGGAVPFDPAKNRIFVRFKDTSGVTRGSTSVVVETQ